MQPSKNEMFRIALSKCSLQRDVQNALSRGVSPQTIAKNLWRMGDYPMRHKTTEARIRFLEWKYLRFDDMEEE